MKFQGCSGISRDSYEFSWTFGVFGSLSWNFMDFNGRSQTLRMSWMDYFMNFPEVS